MTPKDVLKGEWKTVRSQVRQRWHSLTENDVKNINGNYEMLVVTLQDKYQYSRMTAELEADRFLTECALINKPQPV